MVPLASMINKMHDKKRKLDYWKIVRRIEEENRQNPSKPPKGIVGDRPIRRNPSSESSQESAMAILPERILEKLLESRV
jgi:hypothetical protein